MPYLRRRSSSDLRASVGLEDMRLPSSDTEPISIGTFFDISEPDNAKVRVMDGNSESAERNLLCQSLNIWEKPRELGERCEELSVRKDAINGHPDFGFAA